MRTPTLQRAAAVTAAIGTAAILYACPRPQHSAPLARGAAAVPSSTPEALPPALRLNAKPAYHLHIGKGSPTPRASRLVALELEIENTAHDTLIIRPDRVALELADGSRFYAFDRVRALELVRRTKPERLHGNDGEGLRAAERRHAQRRLRQHLLEQTRLGPEQSVTGFVVVDTVAAHRDLGDSSIDVPTDTADGADLEGYAASTRVPLGAPVWSP